MSLSGFLSVITTILDQFNYLYLMQGLPITLMIFYIALIVIVIAGIKELMKK